MMAEVACVVQDYINIELDSNRNQLIRVRMRATTLLCRSAGRCIGHIPFCFPESQAGS